MTPTWPDARPANHPAIGDEAYRTRDLSEAVLSATSARTQQPRRVVFRVAAIVAVLARPFRAKPRVVPRGACRSSLRADIPTRADSGRAHATSWIWLQPPPATLIGQCAWPARGLTLASTMLRNVEILDAAGPAEPIWRDPDLNTHRRASAIRPSTIGSPVPERSIRGQQHDETRTRRSPASHAVAATSRRRRRILGGPRRPSMPAVARIPKNAIEAVDEPLTPGRLRRS